MSAAGNLALASLLEEGVSLDPLYPTEQFGPLTDHLPMALTALAELGASEQQLAGFRAVYAPKLVPRRSGKDIALDDDGWRAALGRHSAYPAFQRYFEAALAAQGRDAVLATWLPRLIDAAAAHALHALIRVGAALHHRVDVELAAALAYWCSCWLAVPAPAGDRTALSPADAFARLRAEPELGGTPLTAAGFEARLVELAARPAFVRASGWRPLATSLGALARESARVYLGTGDFFAMHMVTGSHALRIVAPHAGVDATRVLDRWWQTLAGAYLVIGAPDYSSWRELPSVTLPAPAARLAAAESAFAADDPDHAVKLLWSATAEYAHYGFPEHAQIAARVVSRFAS